MGSECLDGSVGRVGGEGDVKEVVHVAEVAEGEVDVEVLVAIVEDAHLDLGLVLVARPIGYFFAHFT